MIGIFLNGGIGEGLVSLSPNPDLSLLVKQGYSGRVFCFGGWRGGGGGCSLAASRFRV